MKITYKKINTLIYILIGVIIITYVYSIKEQENKKLNISKNEWIQSRIYKHKTKFFSTNTLKVFFNDDGIKVYTAFVPSVGSIPFKRTIYEDVALDAMEIQDFFPEVSEFEYSVLSPSNDIRKKEEITIKIDKLATNNLSLNYSKEKINENGRQKFNYLNVFSSIIESLEAKSWKYDKDTNQRLP